jgi:hypothetical protein
VTHGCCGFVQIKKKIILHQYKKKHNLSIWTNEYHLFSLNKNLNNSNNMIIKKMKLFRIYYVNFCNVFFKKWNSCKILQHQNNDRMLSLMFEHRTNTKHNEQDKYSE